jgi:hypothetical protein
VNPSPNGNFFFSPSASGDPSNGGAITTFNQAAIPMPFACTFTKIYLSTNAVPNGLGLGGAITVTLYKNGVTTALSASGSSTSANVNFATASVSVAAGDLVALYGSGAGFGTGNAPLSTSVQCQ